MCHCLHYICPNVSFFDIFFAFSWQKTMCRSRRSSCVPMTDSWGWSSFLFKHFIFEIRASLQTFNPHRNAFKTSTRGKQCLKFCAGLHSRNKRFGTCLLQIYSNRGLLRVNNPFFFFRATMMWWPQLRPLGPTLLSMLMTQFSVCAPVAWAEFLATP